MARRAVCESPSRADSKSTARSTSKICCRMRCSFPRRASRDHFTIHYAITYYLYAGPAGTLEQPRRAPANRRGLPYRGTRSRIRLSHTSWSLGCFTHSLRGLAVHYPAVSLTARTRSHPMITKCCVIQHTTHAVRVPPRRTSHVRLNSSCTHHAARYLLKPWYLRMCPFASPVAARRPP